MEQTSDITSMESDEFFGPMIAAVEDVTTGDKEDIVQELEKVKKQLVEVMQQKNASETAFGQQRAKFMELFRNKEDELRRTQESLAVLSKTNAELKDQLWRQSAELDDIKTAAAVSEANKLDEIESMRNHFQAEIATLQQFVREDQMRWQMEEERLRTEVTELQNKLSQDRDSFLGSLTRTLQKKIASGTGRDEHQDDIDQDMKKAQEDAEMLRSVIQPLEDEMESLRKQLKHAQAQLAQGGHGLSTDGATSSQLSSAHSNVEDKVKELHENLVREKSSRSDLEMYVAVLNTQKSVLQEDLDKLSKHLRDVCQLLEEEKCENAAVRKLMQMTEERAKEERKILKLTESVLTDDQCQEVASLKVNEKPSIEDRLQQLNAAIEQEEKELENRKTSKEALARKLDSTLFVDTTRANTSAKSPTEDTIHANQDGRDDVTSRHYTLTSAQQASLVAPTVESQASETLLALAKNESLAAVGMRLVTEQEFNTLQSELNAAKEAASRQQEKLDKQLSSLEKSLSDERQRAVERTKYIEELEESLKVVTCSTSEQIAALNNKLEDMMKFLANSRHQFISDQKNILQHIAITVEQRAELQNTLDKVRTENELLVGKKSKHALELQEELINLPNTMEDMQLLLLNYREQLIAAKVAQERACESLSSELELVRAQASEDIERELARRQRLEQELAQAHEQLVIQSSICSELERQRAEMEHGSSSVAVDMRLKQTVASLHQQLQQQQDVNRALEQKLRDLTARYTGNQPYQYFPQPLQSLPPQYQPRVSNNEYAEECTGCRQRFSSSLPKVHCQQCRGAYCSRCVSKTALFGPNLPPASVCDSCYAMNYSRQLSHQ